MQYCVALFYSLVFNFSYCSDNNNNQSLISTKAISHINDSGTTIYSRFNPPEGFKRKELAIQSFAYYLQHLPLKSSGTLVKYYNGEIKPDYAYLAVVDMDISNKNLQQCADAVMRLRGEYLYKIKAYDQISFMLTNGFKMDYSEWIKGNRLVVQGNHTSWKKLAKPGNTYKDFLNYMDIVFMYAGTISLSKSLQHKSSQHITIGDVFVVGGSPGHAVIVIDMAENDLGEKMFLLAQSYMPAQEIQVLKNLNDNNLNPWYSNKFIDELSTPEWTFYPNQLMTW